MAIAKIIVDVPLMQTDQPYSYRIPEEFEGMLEVGMRVHVPFGKGNRLIQGIVLGLDSQSAVRRVGARFKRYCRGVGFFSCAYARTTLAC